MFKTTPPGFSIGFDRHHKCWGWRQRYRMEGDEGRPQERYGFRRRPQALADLKNEIAERSKATNDRGKVEDGDVSSKAPA